MERVKIAKLLENAGSFSQKEIYICGWVRTIRSSKKLGFIELNDGTAFRGVQVVFEEDKIENFKEVSKYNVGSALKIRGVLVLTPEARQPFEISAISIETEGLSAPDYPMQKKRHSMEFLRTVAHLRPRTNTFSAVFRLRSAAAFAIHSFFNSRGFVYVHTPLITANDGEGAGEMFRVTTLDPKSPPLTPEGEVDFAQDFFGKLTGLTVTGQLEGEAMASALDSIYTFGPTFRAERSYTQRHAAEFWMIEPEIAFADIDDDMRLAEDMVKYVIKYVLDACPDEMAFFNKFIDAGITDRLDNVLKSDFGRLDYTEAVKTLEENNANFEYKAFWGCDLQTEHERYLTETVYKKPVFVINYPKEIKAFYMRLNEDKRTVAAMDLLVPGIGELIGGSQREERLDYLIAAMEERGMKAGDYEWYLDLRRFGSVKHAGFGLGFERLIMYISGMANIRDVLPFPRTTGSAEF
ncbi:MAG: asparagine--tRNA ligase [Oscillospiraceae bacterium]|jgi:asparaginyl-tRNA synthetase|nr:asparagine--tRNA ligase [Oscillospiraceae bacterium]